MDDKRENEFLDEEIDLKETAREIEERKEKVKKKISSFADNKYIFAFIGIFILGVVIRLVFFSLTKNQPLWWDEADYMAFAKNIAGVGNVDWIVTEKHNSLFPYIAAIFIKLGSSELVLKFILELIPSILLIFLAYKLCILMYKDKRIALISSFLMATFWSILFNSFRFHLDVPALLFAFLSIYIFWQGYEKKEKIFGKINPKYAVLLTVFLVIFAYAMKKSYALFGLFFLIYMLFTKDLKILIKDKYNWISLSIVVLLFVLLNKFIFISSLNTSSTISDAFGSQFDLVPLQVFGVYFNNLSNPALNVLTWFFWIGLFILLFNLFIGLKFLRRKEGNQELKADFFNFLCLIITLLFFFFLTRNGNLGDERWYFPLLLASFISISKGAVSITDFIGKYYKTIGMIVLILLIGFGGYYEYKNADMIIRNKVNTYGGIKEAGLFLKENSNLGDVIISIPVSQTAYYSERSSLSLAGLFEDKKGNKEISFEEFLEKVKNGTGVKYVIVSFSEPGHPDWMRKETEEYAQDIQTGQITLSKWEIPFMDTKIDFINQKQNIIEEKTYEDITFKLAKIIQNPSILSDSAFIYEVKRDN